jgi:hypothetical protein
MTYGSLAPGDHLANRYRLDEQVDTDAAGRQIWRGTDTVLQRPVALVIRWPGGESAADMLTTAVAASRLVHPHIVSVYDAVDEGQVAYLIREWVAGVSLRDVLRQAPLDAERATLVTHAIAEAVAALHAAGIVHGNVHPGTILIGDDGRVVLADAHADRPADADTDLRALGAVLYACLTAHWPYAEGGHGNLPEAVRDSNGRLASPRQVRGGVPRHLDEIATELLDLRVTPPPAATIAGDFARLATQGTESEYDDSPGPMGFGEGRYTRRRVRWAKMALGAAVLSTIALVGALVAVRVLGGGGTANAVSPQITSPSQVASANTGPPLQISPSQVRIVDPPRGDGTELSNAGLTVDGDPNTGWSTDDYTQAYFGGSSPGGGIKPGMGVLIDLGKLTTISAVKVVVNTSGASVGLRTGPTDPGVGVAPGSAARDADGQIAKNFTDLAPAVDDFDGTNIVFSVSGNQQVRYLLVWVTKLPPKPNRGYSITIDEIVVYPGS